MKEIKKGSIAWKVKSLLENNESLRDSDKKLVWSYWIVYDKAMSVDNKTLILEDYMNTTPVESITRARRLVQELFADLRGSEWVQEQRELKEQSKGGFVTEVPVEVKHNSEYSEEVRQIRERYIFRGVK